MPPASRNTRKSVSKVKGKSSRTQKPARKLPTRKTATATKATRKVARNASVDKPTPTRLKGLDAAIYKMAASLLPRRAPFLAVLKTAGLTPDMVLRTARLIEETLRVRLPKGTMAPSFVDVLSMARDKEILSLDGYHLATRIRHIRNSIAHGQTESRKVEASCALVATAATLLFCEMEAA